MYLAAKDLELQVTRPSIAVNPQQPVAGSPQDPAELNLLGGEKIDTARLEVRPNLRLPLRETSGVLSK